MAKTYTWDVQIAAAAPCTPEGSTKCMAGFMHTCTDGVWEKNIPDEPCGGAECDKQLTPETCEQAGCYWYAFPNPFGEPSCHGEPIFIKYLPFIAVGVGAVIVAAFLLSGRKSPPMMYYPPPQYYPPQQYQPPPYNPPPSKKKKGGK